VRAFAGANASQSLLKYNQAPQSHEAIRAAQSRSSESE